MDGGLNLNSASTDAANDSPASTGTAPSPGTLGGLAGHLRGLGASLCEHASLRAELAATEFQQEKRELAALAVGLVVFCALAATTLLFAGLAVVFIGWDTPYRDQLVIAVLSAFFLATALAGAWIAHRLGRERHPFGRTVAELRRDAAMLRRFPS